MNFANLLLAVYQVYQHQQLLQFVDRVDRPNGLDLDRIAEFWVIRVRNFGVLDDGRHCSSFSVFLEKLRKKICEEGLRIPLCISWD